MSRHRKTRIELLAVCNEIRRLRAIEGYDNSRIIQALRIPVSDFYYYQQKVFEQDRRALERTGELDLAHEILTLKDRLEDSYRNLSEIAKNTGLAAKDRIEAESRRMEAAINVVKLQKEGPNAIGYIRTTQPAITSKPELAAASQ